jgi:hypothetical protein
MILSDSTVGTHALKNFAIKFVFFTFFVTSVTLFSASPAYSSTCAATNSWKDANVSTCMDCESSVDNKSNNEWTQSGNGSSAGTWPRVRDHMTAERTGMQIWTATIFWEDNILPALMMMADQLTAVAMQQTQIIGSFLDAKHQLETQQVFQRLEAQAHKDYHPSTGMCEFGSISKSLAASERKSELTAIVASARSQDRALGNQNTLAASGQSGDKEGRIKQFREKFCDPRDNNDGLAELCDHDQAPGGTLGAAAPGGIGAPNASASRKNKDIDFIRTVDFPWTLNVDFTDATLTDNEEEVLALAANLYGHDIFQRATPPESLFSTTTPGAPRINSMQKIYMDMRAVLAKRSVAENSFNAIMSMKAAGTPGSRAYMVGLMNELGISSAEINQLLGPNPSYNAQMEVLTKKIFQSPDFYTNLYETPANVKRKGVAIQAIGLMQKFDLYKSYLRNEASLSVLLELAVQDIQSEVEDKFGRVKGSGPTGVP